MDGDHGKSLSMMKEHEDCSTDLSKHQGKKVCTTTSTFSIGELAHERRFSNTTISNDNVFESIFLSGCIHDVTCCSFLFVSCFKFPILSFEGSHVPIQGDVLFSRDNTEKIYEVLQHDQQMDPTQQRTTTH